VSARARRGTRGLGDEGGATALEFALVAPLLIVLLVGTFQLAWAMHCAASVRWSLETNARSLLMTPGTTADQLKTAMVSQLGGVADTSNLTVTLTTDSSIAGAKVLVAASTYTASLAVPMLAAQTLTFNAKTSVPSP